MKKLLLCFALITTPLYANEVLIEVPVVCSSDVKGVSRAVATYGEKSFFKARSSRTLEDGTNYINGIVMFVNPDTKTWTLVEITEDGMFCVLAAGEDLKPAK